MFTSRILALLCCLPLALPPGSCQLPFSEPGSSAVSQPTSSPCQHCRTDAERPPPSDLPPATQCCCSDRHAVTPPGVTALSDFGEIAVLIPADDALRLASRALLAAGPIDILCQPRLHVLHCVWLC